MNFLGVGPFELVLVLGLALIVLGPERMQEMGRTAGRLVARLLAWQHQSPEARMIQDVRKDFEREIVELRDELVRAKQQVDVSKEVQRLRQDANTIMSRKNLLSEPPAETKTTTPPPASAQATEAADEQAASPDTPRPTSETPDEERSIGGSPPYQHATETRTVARRSAKSAQANSSAAAPTAADYELLQQQVQMLAATMQALQEQLRVQGILDTDWQPPAQDTQSSPAQHETVTS